MEGNAVTSSTGYEDFFRHAAPRALAVACRITSNQQDAEDVVIETFARAYVRWGRLEHASWRDGWIVTVSTNLALDVVRRRKREHVGEFSRYKDRSVDLAEQIIDRISLVEALRMLPLRQRGHPDHLRGHARRGQGIGRSRLPGVAPG